MDKYLIRKPQNESNYDVVKEHVTNYVVSSDYDSKGESSACSLGIAEYAAKGQKEEKRNATENNCYVMPKKRMNLDMRISDCSPKISFYIWRSITAEDLSLKYTKLFAKATADSIFQKLEEEVEYFLDEQVKVRVYGKWHNIPRKQVSYGDPGLSYTFSGTCIPAVSWTKCNIITHLKEIVESVSQHSFNFVLVNRYKDGMDHMGEHRDDEKDLVQEAPIASLSFGQARDFIFKHKDSRGAKCLRKIDPVKLELEHGSLLLMQWPTNKLWYHSLPVRKNARNVRINLTFRNMVKKG